MTNRINEMIGAIDSAQSEAERNTARAKLAALQKENAQVQAEIDAAKADAAKAERQKGVNISKECMENPLAKGCL
jgi:multidrug resistance efflux pump